MYKIQLCTENEVDKLQLFIKNTIRENEILAHDKKLLKWQNFNKISRNYNFIIALNLETNEIAGLFGFIPTYQYDDNLRDHHDVWGSNWIVNEEKLQEKGLGLQLFFHFQKFIKPISFGAIGITNVALSIYKAFKYKTGTLNHYFILNKKINNFKIATNVKLSYQNSLQKEGKSKFNLAEVKKIEDLKLDTDFSHRPKKSTQYLKNRYLKHPVYKYRFFIVTNNSNFFTIFVIKKIYVNGASCLRIIDILGDISYLRFVNFNKLLKQENSEYIDCLNYGIDEKLFLSSGFLKREKEIIIPEHFEPFEKKNIDVKFAYKCNCGNYVIFKGDGALDRPNKVKM